MRIRRPFVEVVADSLSSIRLYLAVTTVRVRCSSSTPRVGAGAGTLEAVTTIETERLVLRRWQMQTDLAPFNAVNRDPEVMRFLRDGHLESEEETAASIDVWEREWVESGFGLWAAELKSTGALTGALPTVARHGGSAVG
jgi:RimJ/RimL family protein N-acetyltransferase